MKKQQITFVSNPYKIDWKKYKSIQLESLLSDPNAFEKQYQDEIKLASDDWQLRVDRAKSGKFLAVFASYQGHYIGKIFATRSSHDIMHRTITIFGFYVNIRFRGTSLAHQLLHKLLRKITLKYKRKITAIHLFVTKSQIRAIKFYTQEGYHITGEDNLKVSPNIVHSGYHMQKTINVKAAFKILDLGCGRGAKITRLQKRGMVTGVDISPEFIDICRQQFPQSSFLVMNGLSLKFPAHYFDEVYCLDVIEHVTDPEKLLDQVHRVLKKNGRLYLDIPYYLSEKLLTTFNSNYPQQVHHQTIFPPEKIISLLNQHKFKITQCRFTKFIDNYYLLRHFLHGHAIENQQGDITPATKADHLLLLIMQHIYHQNGYVTLAQSPLFSDFNQFSLKTYHLPLADLFKTIKLVNELVSPTFPKTISLVCAPHSQPQNNLKSLSPQKISPNLKRLSDSHQITSLTTKVNHLSARITDLQNANQTLKQELFTIKDSQLYRLWPIYQKLKSIIKSTTPQK